MDAPFHGIPVAASWSELGLSYREFRRFVESRVATVLELPKALSEYSQQTQKETQVLLEQKPWPLPAESRTPGLLVGTKWLHGVCSKTREGPDTLFLRT